MPMGTGQFGKAMNAFGDNYRKSSKPPKSKNYVDLKISLILRSFAGVGVWEEADRFERQTAHSTAY